MSVMVPAGAPVRCMKLFVTSVSIAPMSAKHEENGTWARLSAAVVEDFESLDQWQKLVRESERVDGTEVSKVSSAESLSLLRATYEAFLAKFPLMTHYWIRYAHIEFRIGHYERAVHVYNQALVHLNGSVELWTSYLRFKVDTITNNVQEIAHLFETGRLAIGRHYYSHEFYQLYLEFIKNYVGADADKQYLILLRTIIEQPIYHYNLFAKMFFSAISNLTETTIAYIVPQHALKSYGDLNQAANKLKKLFTDVYITTQAKSHQLFSYERHLERQYFDVRFVPQGQLKQWHNYLSFLELNFQQKHVIQVYERCILITAAYPEFWLRYAEYHISQDKLVGASEILTRGMVYCSSYKILLKLVDIELSLNNYTKARDLLVGYIRESVGVPIPIYEKLLSVETLFHTDNSAVLRDIIVQAIKDCGGERFFELLDYYALPAETKREIRDQFNYSKNTENEVKDFAAKFQLSIASPTK